MLPIDLIGYCGRGLATLSSRFRGEYSFCYGTLRNFFVSDESLSLVSAPPLSKLNRPTLLIFAPFFIKLLKRQDVPWTQNHESLIFNLSLFHLLDVVLVLAFFGCFFCFLFVFTAIPDLLSVAEQHFVWCHGTGATHLAVAGGSQHSSALLRHDSERKRYFRQGYQFRFSLLSVSAMLRSASIKNGSRNKNLAALKNEWLVVLIIRMQFVENRLLDKIILGLVQPGGA